MREVTKIIIHTTATVPDAKVSSILNYWREHLGWKSPGYHMIIETNGDVTKLQGFDKPTNGVRGHNSDSIHISYIGGLGEHDTRTEEQKASILNCIYEALQYAPNAKIYGHNNFTNKKTCPNFDAKKEYEWITR